MATSSSPAYRRLSEDERRRLLIDATITVLSEHGLAGTTVRRIAARAGVTPGLVTHYFDGKAELVSAAYRSLADRFHSDYAAASDAAGDDPLERLRAYVGSVFKPETLDRNLLRVWTSFWTSALTDPASRPARVHYETARESRDWLKRLVRDVLESRGRKPSAADVEELAIAIWSLVDGMWLTWGLDPDLFDADQGRRIVFEVIAARLDIPEIAAARDGQKE